MKTNRPKYIPGQYLELIDVIVDLDNGTIHDVGDVGRLISGPDTIGSELCWLVQFDNHMYWISNQSLRQVDLITAAIMDAKYEAERDEEIIQLP